MSKLVACLSGVALGFTGVATLSQETSGLELEEIVVTATKRATDLQKTSISIQTYSGEQLKQEGKKRIDDIMAGVVGVQVQGGIVGSNFYMRGVDSGTQGGNSQASVAVLIDGIYQNRGEVVRGGSLDVAQVEVARGTQSTNLGASAIAGAISLVSNQPAFEYQATGSLEAGNYDMLNLEGVLNVPVTDNQAVRVAYSSNKRDGYYANGVGDNDLQNARLKYRWQINDAVNTVFTISQNKIGGNGSETGALLARGLWQPWITGATTNPALSGCYPTGATILVVGCKPMYWADIATGQYYFERNNPWEDNHSARFPNNPFRHTNIIALSAEVTWNTGIGTLKLTPSVQRSSFESNETPFNIGGWGAENREQKTRSFEAQLSSPGDSKLQWTGGLYYYWTNQTGTMTNVIVPGGMGCAATSADLCYTWSSDQETMQETKSAYANANYSVTDALRLSAGVRYAQDQKSYISNLSAAGTGTATVAGNLYGPTTAFNYNCVYTGTAPNCAAAKWTATSYSAGVEYDVLPQSMVYAKISTGYQPGGVSAMGGITPKLTLEQITLGIKNRFFDNKLQLNVEAFDTRYHDRTVQGGIASVQLSNTVSTTCTLPTGFTASYYLEVNTTGAGCLYYTGTATAPDVVSRGVDLEVNFLPTASDRVDMSLEYLDSSYQSIPELAQGAAYPTAAYIQSLTNSGNGGAITAAQAQALAGNFTAGLAAYNKAVLQNAAEWSGNFSYSHRFTLSGGGTLTPKLSATYKSKYWTLNGPSANIGLANQAMQSGYGRYYSNGTFAAGIQPSYSLFDAYTTWQAADGKYSLAAYVKNIESEPILAGASTTTVNGVAIPRQVYLLAPRTFGLTFSANF